MDSDKILGNWKKLLSYVDEYFEDGEKENTLKLFKHFEDRFIDAPASSRPNHHNCFAGGLVDHMLRVIDTSLKQKKLFSHMGVQVKASDADIVMAAMFHDLGKIGDLDNAYYIRQTDEWRRNKLNEWYTFNPKLEPLSVTDRALWLLQWFDVKISQEVWKAIKLSDGMFDDVIQLCIESMIQIIYYTILYTLQIGRVLLSRSNYISSRWKMWMWDIKRELQKIATLRTKKYRI